MSSKCNGRDNVLPRKIPSNKKKQHSDAEYVESVFNCDPKIERELHNLCME